MKVRVSVVTVASLVLFGACAVRPAWQHPQPARSLRADSTACEARALGQALVERGGRADSPAEQQGIEVVQRGHFGRCMRHLGWVPVAASQDPA